MKAKKQDWQISSHNIGYRLCKPVDQLYKEYKKKKSESSSEAPKELLNE